MIGDSLTRYQYQSLVYFLEHGSFTSEPDCTWAYEFSSWDVYFEVGA